MLLHLIRLALPGFLSSSCPLGVSTQASVIDGGGATCPAKSVTSLVLHYPANAKKLISHSRLSPLFIEEEHMSTTNTLRMYT